MIDDDGEMMESASGIASNRYCGMCRQLFCAAAKIAECKSVRRRE